MKYLISLCLIWVGCTGNAEHPEKLRVENTAVTPAYLKESFNEDDIYPRDYYVDELKPVRENFKKLNSIPAGEWMSVEDTTYVENGLDCKASFYCYVAELDKIIVRKNNDTVEMLKEYYFLNKQLSFLLEKEYDKRTEGTFICKSYFFKDKLIYQDLGDCGAPNTEEFTLEEERRIKAETGNLRQHKKH